MQTNDNAAPLALVTEETAPCRICDQPVDLRRLCAVWKNGDVAHLDCYFTARKRMHVARAGEFKVVH